MVAKRHICVPETHFLTRIAVVTRFFINFAQYFVVITEIDVSAPSCQGLSGFVWVMLFAKYRRRPSPLPLIVNNIPRSN